MIRKTIFAAATLAAIGAAALIPTQASAGGGGKRWGNGRRLSRPRRPWLLGRRVRRRCFDRTELLAVDPGCRQGVRLLLIFADDSNSIRDPGLASRNRGCSMWQSHRRFAPNSFAFGTHPFSCEGDEARGSPGCVLDLRQTDDQRGARRRHLVKIGDIFQAPAARRQPSAMNFEILRRTMVER